MPAFATHLRCVMVLPVSYHIVQIVRPRTPVQVRQTIVLRIIVDVARFVFWRARANKRFQNETVNESLTLPLALP